MSKTSKSQQRLEDAIIVLQKGRDSIGSLAAMMAAKGIIDEAIAEHEIGLSHKCGGIPKRVFLNTSTGRYR